MLDATEAAAGLDEGARGLLRASLRGGAVFAGREGEVRRLEAWARGQGPAVTLLAGPAGRGKSALLARLCARLAADPGLAVVFVAASRKAGTNLATSLLVSLASLVARKLGEPPAVSPTAPLSRVRDALRGLLERAGQGDRPLIILLDGLDELADDLEHGLLGGQKLGARLLLAVRADDSEDAWGLARRLGLGERDAAHMALPPLDEEAMDEALEQASLPAAHGAAAALVAATRGEPILLTDALAAIRAEVARAVERAASSLGDLSFEASWQRSSADASPELQAAMGVVLGLLSAALGPLQEAEFLALAAGMLDAATTEQATAALGPLLVRECGAVALRSAAVRSWVQGRMSVEERRGWDGYLAGWGLQVVSQTASWGGAAVEIPPYVARYLGAHLARSGADPEKLRWLLGRAWLAARERVDGSLTGFLADVDRVARACREQDDFAASHGAPQPHLIDEVRAQLWRATAAEGASKIPGRLLSSLVSEGLWSIERALAQVATSPAHELPHALERLLEPTPASAGDEVWTRLVEALGWVKEESWRAWKLGEIADKLPPRAHALAIEQACRVGDPFQRCLALGALLTGLPQPRRGELATRARAHLLRHDSSAYALASGVALLVPHLAPEDQADALRQALEALLSLGTSDPIHAERIAAAATPALLEVAVDDRLARRLLAAPGVVQALASHLPPSLQQLALKAASGYPGLDAARTEVCIILHLDPGWRARALPEVLDRVRALKENHLTRARLLLELCPHAPEADRRAIQQEAQLALLELGDPSDHLSELLPRMAPEFAPRLLDAMKGLASRKAAALAQLADDLPPSLHLLALDLLAQQQRGDVTSHRLLRALFPRLAPGLRARALDLAERLGQTECLIEHTHGTERELLIDKALASARRRPHADDRALGVLDVARLVEPPLRRALLLEALALANPPARPHPAVEAAAHLAEPLLDGQRAPLLQAALGLLPADDLDVDLIVRLAPMLDPPVRAQILQAALARSRASKDTWSRVLGVRALLKETPEPEREALCWEVFPDAMKLHGQQRRDAAEWLGPSLGRRAPEAFALAQQAQPDEQAWLTVPLARALGPSHGQVILEQIARVSVLEWRLDLLRQLAVSLREDSLGACLDLLETWLPGLAFSRSEHFSKILALLGTTSPALAPRVIALARRVEAPAQRWQALARVARLLQGPERDALLDEAAAAAQREGFPQGTLELLGSRLSPEARQLALKRALDAAISGPDQLAARSRALVSLAPELPDALLDQALSGARAMKEPTHRCRPLAALALRLDDPGRREALLSDALDAALAVNRTADERAAAVAAVAETIALQPPPTVRRLFSRTIDLLATERRYLIIATLRGLRPLLAALGGPQALLHTAYAILEVTA